MNQKKIFCENCGNELEQDSKFCTKCGAKNELMNHNSSLHSQMTGMQEQSKFYSNQSDNNNMYKEFFNNDKNMQDSINYQNVMSMNRNYNNNYSNNNMSSGNINNNQNYSNSNSEINNSNYNTSSYQEKQEFNWTTVGGIACGVVAMFIFWWLAFAGLSIEIKALKDIKEKNQKGKIVAYIGIAICGACVILYFVGNII